ncbi:MAG: mannitol dehydrogenase family protein [Acidobacteria bacterium]|jgi:mannitol 2-dehydrogenase|nr:mannitol dehydrogenase family protein [Acidobacteriota bacterium]
MDRDRGPRPSVPLAARTLAELDPRVTVPTYDRTSLGRGIVHIGVGGFHRAHQAAYLDDLCQNGLTDWSITGAGVLPGDAAMADALQQQDNLYTLITRDRESTDPRVIGSIVDYVLATPAITPLIDVLADPSTRIVSLTITEGGYPVDDTTGQFLTSPEGDLPPAFEAIARALQRRRDEGLGGFSVVSCDNIMHNGATARAATLGVAATVEPGLEEWIGRNVSFPNTMVDRITPATTAADRDLLVDRYGLVDRWPVVAEPFTQWVIEDSFLEGRPPWEDAGALFTTDVEPYETLKLRLLNGGHSCLAYLAALAGHVHVHEVMADRPFVDLLRCFLEDEASPALPSSPPGINVARYRIQLAERFANPAVSDQVVRLCQDGTSKLPKFLIPTIETQLKMGGQVKMAALALAGWCQYLLGKDDTGRDLEIARDPNLRLVTELAEASTTDPRAFLRFTGVFSMTLANDAVFAPAFAAALASLREVGVHSTLDRWLRGDA